SFANGAGFVPEPFSWWTGLSAKNGSPSDETQLAAGTNLLDSHTVTSTAGYTMPSSFTALAGSSYLNTVKGGVTSLATVFDDYYGNTRPNSGVVGAVLVPPVPPLGLKATPNGSQIALSWTQPVNFGATN